MPDEFSVLAQKAALTINNSEAAQLANHLVRISAFVSLLNKTNMPTKTDRGYPGVCLGFWPIDEVGNPGKADTTEKHRFSIPPLFREKW